jgi:DNA-binding MarR family transcriptional regulator
MLEREKAVDKGLPGSDPRLMARRETKERLRTLAHARLWRVSNRIHGRLTEVLEPFGLSEPQFNVLRILRGAGPEGLPCKEVGARMVTRVPDVTRLMDRLEKAGWLVRTRHSDDRRVVVARISPAGRELLREVDPVVTEEHERLFAGFSAADLEALLELLDLVEVDD